MVVKVIRRMLLLVLTAGVMAGCPMAGSLYGGSYGGGGGGGTMMGPGYNGSNAAGVYISGFAFSPSSVTFPASGSVTVTWTNKDGVTHTVTSDTSSALVFDSGNVGAGGTFSFSVPSSTPAGTYTYHCSIHTYMHGSITVQ